MTDFVHLLNVLNNGSVEFIVIGGFAATAHGSSHTTVDLDIVYSRTEENISRLVTALEPLQPYLRGAPPGLPFRFDVDTVKRGLIEASPSRKKLAMSHAAGVDLIKVVGSQF